MNLTFISNFKRLKQNKNNSLERFKLDTRTLIRKKINVQNNLMRLFLNVITNINFFNSFSKNPNHARA